MGTLCVPARARVHMCGWAAPVRMILPLRMRVRAGVRTLVRDVHGRECGPKGHVRLGPVWAWVGRGWVSVGLGGRRCAGAWARVSPYVLPRATSH